MKRDWVDFKECCKRRLAYVGALGSMAAVAAVVLWPQDARPMSATHGTALSTTEQGMQLSAGEYLRLRDYAKGMAHNAGER
ncbi:MAG: hypothetical protein H6922_05540 [Pseudomonadaceae bacterium]|nr:hypothetical protein [Pseudomonadaceae bacterium]